MDKLMWERARGLRCQQTDAERWLWLQLRGHRFLGMKFRRQVPMGAYIADFVCHTRRLVIELDGGQHAEQIDHDTARTAWLNEQGYRVLRFWSHDMLQQEDAVLEQICLWLEQEQPSPPTSRLWRPASR